MDNIVLYKNKSECCGCGACYSICPNKAISMKKDIYGFIYPIIDEGKCIKCGMCKKICAFQKDNKYNVVLKTYAASSKNKNTLLNSSSGGIAYEISKSFVKNNGIVYGCKISRKNDSFVIEHDSANTVEDLYKFSGSKYVKSDTSIIFDKIKSDLKNGNKVLFIGTPCQVSEVKEYCLNYSSNLYTIDIICHGVPNQQIFNDYIKDFENKKHIKITNINFRDKSKGTKYRLKIDYLNNKNEEKIKYINSHSSSYYQLFLNSLIDRDNCYTCKYAQNDRTGDLTIGDYWGISIEHPELLKSGKLNENYGISCVMENSTKGKEIISLSNNSIDYYESNFEKVAKHNKQLNKPTVLSMERERVLNNYLNNGYSGIERYYNKKNKIKKIIYVIWDLIPNNIKIKLK